MIAHRIQPPDATAGPYRDIDAAVRFAALRLDMAILKADATDATAWQYELVTTRDETVALTINMPPDPDPNVPVVPTTIVARIGYLGSPAREKLFVEEIQARLKAVRKTGIAAGEDG